MKITLVADRLGPGTGTGGQLWLVACALRERHDVVVWCRRVDARPDGIEVHTTRRLWWAPATGGVRVAFGRVPGCEVVRASGGVHAAYLRACGRRPWPRDLLTSVLERRAARRCVRLICNAEHVAARMVEEHHLDPSHVRLVRNGVDLARFRPDDGRRTSARAAWAVPRGGRVAAFVAHGFRRKNLATAVAAFGRVATDADRLVVAGRDAHAGRWLRDARRALGGKLVVCGPLVAPEAVLPGADALLHPTRYDAAANVVLEAMACGVPPVTTAADGASELVPDRSLVVRDALDVDEVAAALVRAWAQDGGARWRVIAEQWPESRMTRAIEEVVTEAGGP